VFNVNDAIVHFSRHGCSTVDDTAVQFKRYMHEYRAAVNNLTIRPLRQLISVSLTAVMAINAIWFSVSAFKNSTSSDSTPNPIFKFSFAQ
jgi:hypothetical protein